MLFDLISISNRYPDRDLFLKPSRANKFYIENNADKEILKDTLLSSFSTIIYNAKRQSFFFHNSVGGYHGAKT